MSFFFLFPTNTTTTRPSSAQTIMNVSIVNLHKDQLTVRDHLAWVSVTVVVVLGIAIFAVLLLWRTKLE